MDPSVRQTPFFRIQGLEHSFPLGPADGQVQALRGIDLSIHRGEFVALIGANGSGKSTLAYHLNGLLLPTKGQVQVDGMLTSDPQHTWDIRRRVGMVFQNPDNQLVASTVEEDVAFGPENYGLASSEIRRRVDEALASVGLGEARTRPPQMLSGGQKQLVAIAGALATYDTPGQACIVFDEPTSMLDPASRRQVLATIHELHREQGLTVVLITQSMQEAASAQRILVMDQGRLLMDGTPQEVFAHAKPLLALGLGLPPAAEIAHHLNHQGIELAHGLLTIEALVEALVEHKRRSRMLIQIEGLTHIYAPRTPLAHTALHNIDLEIGPGERVGIVGSTGSGKSTLVQHIAGLLEPTSGRVLLDGIVAHGRSPATRARRRRIGLAFQYPEDQIFEQTVFREVGFGPRNLGLPPDEIETRVRWALDMVGLAPEAVGQRNPLTLSGGEMRRVALASSLSMQPEVLILDEPTAGMDPRGRRDILSRIGAWQQSERTLIVVSHDMAELARLVDRVVLLNNGRLAADGPAHQILSDVELLASSGLEATEPVYLLRALQDAGWLVRTDILLPDQAADEIARAQGIGSIERARQPSESPGAQL